MNAPMSAVITESFAKELFGNAPAVGKTFLMENKHTFTITAIMKDFPEQSHIQSDMVVSFNSMKNVHPYGYKSWNVTNTNIYFSLKEKTDIKSLETKIATIYKDARPDYDGDPTFMLQPLERIYLHSSDVRWDAIKKGDAEVVTGLSIVALLILIIACFNYMNLTTANYTKEADNISVSKTLGATRKHLVWKYFSETILMTFIAIWIAIILSEILMPAFNNFTEKNLHISLLQNKSLALSLSGIFILTVLLGGTYPAFFLTSFKPLNLRKKVSFFSTSSSGHSLWRKSFVIAQYMIAIVLIISTFIIYKQIQLITKEKTGFDKEQVITVKNPWDQEMTNRYNIFIDKIRKNPNILHAAGSFNVPGERINNQGMLYIEEENKLQAGNNIVSPEFFSVLNATFLDGRNFKKELASDSSAVIVNERAVKSLGLEDPVGKEIYYTSYEKRPLKIIGVIKNIQYASLHEKTLPLVYLLDPHMKLNIVAKIQQGKTSETLAFLKKQWEEVSQKWPFEYEFIDEKIDNVYKTELKTIALIRIFTLLSIFLSCLGIFGFAGFSIKKRTKEIGIRKVNGATVLNILTLLNKDFIKWVLMSFLIACPIAYFVMNKWLQNYAYKTEMNWWVFVLGGALTIIIAILTVSWQSWRAARQNPVDSLKYE